MANGILSAAAKAASHTPQYRLRQEDRQAILAQSDHSAKTSAIERERIAFAEKNFGFSFGLEPE